MDYWALSARQSLQGNDSAASSGKGWSRAEWAGCGHACYPRQSVRRRKHHERCMTLTQQTRPGSTTDTRTSIYCICSRHTVCPEVSSSYKGQPHVCQTFLLLVQFSEGTGCNPQNARHGMMCCFSHLFPCEFETSGSTQETIWGVIWALGTSDEIFDYF